jgi:L-asparaginase
MQSGSDRIVILGTGGTIAGTAPSPTDAVGYRAAQLGVDALVAAVPALAMRRLECEQVAQIDSKDMDEAIWLALARRAAFHLARPEVRGVVVTHGTDTLEETGYLLQRVLAPARPLVLTAAMRPATSHEADGPQNLLDAVAVAQTPGARGVLAVLAGHVHAGDELRKRHTQRVDAFGSGDAGPVAHIAAGRLARLRDWPSGDGGLGIERLAEPPWPHVEIVTSHAGAGGALVRAARAAGVRGLVVAATGNGTVHHALLEALLEAQAAGVVVWRSTRCLDGGVLPHPDDRLASAGALTPVQARIELQLQLMGAAPAR